MNKAKQTEHKIIKGIIIPSLIGVLIAFLFLLAVVKPTRAGEDSTRPMTGTVYFVSGRSVSIVSPDKQTWSYKGKGFKVGDTVSCVVSNNGNRSRLRRSTRSLCKRNILFGKDALA